MDMNHLLVSMLLILTAAWGLGYIFSRLGLPLMLGELVAGLILGPPLLGWVTASPSLTLLADFGIFFAMFYAGIEMDPRETLEHFWPSLATAAGGAVLPFILGYFTALWFGGTTFQSLFMGLGISVTAVAVQSVILKSMRINRTPLGHIIIGAAIVNDILALISLSVLLTLAKTGELDAVGLIWLLGKTIGFFALTISFGEFVMPRLARRLTDEEAKGFTFAMTVALAMAYLAELAGLHLIIGAFLAGQFVRREIMDEKIYDAIADRFYAIAYGFLMPIFFASLSFHLVFRWSWNFLLLTAVLTIVAILGKVLGAGLAIRLFGHTSGEALVVGLGMNGRGAVELVIAAVVLTLSDELTAAGALATPLLTQEQFSALILMAFITTLMTPLTMKWAVLRTCLGSEQTHFCRLWEEGRVIESRD